jgi:hypothetical protein
MADVDFRSRPRAGNSGADRKYIETLVERLEELRIETDPEGGATTAVDKDHKAFRALRFASQLVDALAGWAVDHSIGLASKGASFLPTSSRLPFAYDEYERERDIVNNHDHELRGSRLVQSRMPLEPMLIRHALANLLLPQAGALLPSPISRPAIEALEALDYGETTEVLRPVAKGRKRKLRALRGQLRALAHLEFQSRRGLQRQAAEKKVALKFGVEVKTLRTWNRRVPEGLGKLPVARALGFAKNAASYVDSTDPDSHLNWLAYTDEQLEEDGQSYIRLQGFKGAGASNSGLCEEA